jgi:HD-like signal output (HDOD) protein
MGVPIVFGSLLRVLGIRKRAERKSAQDVVAQWVGSARLGSHSAAPNKSRRHVRWEWARGLLLRSGGTEIPAQAFNVSASGVGLYVPVPLRIGSRVEINAGMKSWVVGRVVYVSAPDQAGAYRAGVEYCLSEMDVTRPAEVAPSDAKAHVDSNVSDTGDRRALTQADLKAGPVPAQAAPARTVAEAVAVSAAESCAGQPTELGEAAGAAEPVQQESASAFTAVAEDLPMAEAAVPEEPAETAAANAEPAGVESVASEPEQPAAVGAAAPDGESEADESAETQSTRMDPVVATETAVLEEPVEAPVPEVDPLLTAETATEEEELVAAAADAEPVEAELVASEPEQPVAVAAAASELAAADAGIPAELMWWRNAATGLVSPPKRPAEKDAPELVEFLQRATEHAEIELPALPHVTEVALAMVRDESVDFAELARVLQQDAAITARLLRLVNSAAFGGAHKIVSLREAVTRLGRRRVQNVLVTASVRDVAIKEAGEAKILGERLWKCSIATATIMSSGAPRWQLDPELAFLVGLLHDIGALAALRVTHLYARHYSNNMPVLLFDWLVEQWHERAGRTLAVRWKFDEPLPSLIGDHHSPVSPADEWAPYRHTLQFADLTCALLGYAAPAPCDFFNEPCVQALGIEDTPEWQRWLVELPGRIAEHIADCCEAA